MEAYETHEPRAEETETRTQVIAAIDLAYAGDGDEGVLRRAIALVGQTPSAMLHALFVLSGDDGPFDAPGDLERQVIRLASSMGLLRGEKVGIHVRRGEPADEIVRFTTEMKGAVVLVGDHHRGLLRRLALGSVRDRVASRAPCPVIVVGGGPTVPAIEPPCNDCLDARFASGGARFWCARHETHHPRPHTYSFSREHPFVTHDSNVTPTGV